MRATAIAMSVGALVLGLTTPSLAARMGHLLVALLAIIVLVAAIQPALSGWLTRRAMPFVIEDQSADRAITPAVIATLADEVAAPNRYVGPKVRSRIRAIAAGRLDDRHPAGTPAAVTDDRVELSPALGAIMDASDAADRIPVRDLDALLTEVEEL